MASARGAAAVAAAGREVIDLCGSDSDENGAAAGVTADTLAPDTRWVSRSLRRAREVTDLCSASSDDEDDEDEADAGATLLHVVFPPPRPLSFLLLPPPQLSLLFLLPLLLL